MAPTVAPPTESGDTLTRGKQAQAAEAQASGTSDPQGLLKARGAGQCGKRLQYRTHTGTLA
eukprot:CAMPEP_0182801036 /NCGR_PEP_ID=MMETSP0006_2-20121128/2731_1 /TAXON_ID=97485 /ORGANISM="Prymnesium parvum, Strain Texoma1" /LENGTH=60 /DNA_ID=CAMNT_0024926317 /DNA_START=146 /DNA_END=323 /DNA_ORIENTATION=-